MQNILLITSSFPDRRPGEEAAGSFVADFAYTLSQQAHVTVVAPGLKDSEENYRNCRIHRFRVPKLPLSQLKLYSPVDWIYIAKTFLTGSSTCENIIKQEKFDHILALWALPSGYWARQQWLRHKVPYTVWALGSDIWSMSKIPVVKQMLNIILRDACVRLADGYILAEQVFKISGKDCNFLASVRSLDIHERQQRSFPPYRIAFLGRWHPNKGVDLLLNALEKLNGSDWARIEEVRICGGGPLEPYVLSRIAALKADNRPVTSLGYLGKKEAAQLLTWCDYLCVPSRKDSIPVVFSDAMQSGCPVITTPVGDMPRLIEQYGVGFLSTSYTASSIAGALRKALNSSPACFASQIENARGEFNVRQSVANFLHFVEAATNVR